MVRQRKNRQSERGFTLAFTIMLTVVLSLAAVAIMAKVFVSSRQSGFTKERQNTMDAAVIGLNMALDEISPGLDRMRNAVWTSAAADLNAPPGSYYPPLTFTQTQMKADGTTANAPVRQLSLVGNIRNWEAFGNWAGTTTAEWNKGWTYVASSSAVQYFDAAPGQTGRATISIGAENTTGAYWYKQIDPKPPVLANGAPDVPTRANGTKVWPNSRGVGIYGNEYPYGLFAQPVLRKVYQVRQNPMVRVAVYVRMSLQDYYGPEVSNGRVVYRNRDLDGRTVPTGQNGLDSTTDTFDGRNFLETNAITFSVFAVSEGTGDSKGVRIHQALNVTLGGAEYISGLSPRLSNGTNINLNGLENDVRRFQATPLGATPYYHLMSPYMAPTLDTPSGNNQLTAHAPITGQVYPASGDLSLNFSTRPATETAVFLYERVALSGTDNAFVVFLIEQIPPSAVGNTQRYWRRRLLFDGPRGYYYHSSGPANTWDSVASPGYNENRPLTFARASYSINPWLSSSGFPSMLWWANKEASNAQIQVPDYLNQEHFYLNTSTPHNLDRTDDRRYPYSARLDRFGNFEVSTRSAGDAGMPAAGDVRGDVVNWSNNPLVDYRGGRLAANMPWQGPTVPVSTAEATVSYFATTWPKNAWSTIWLGNGGGVGLSFTAATWSVF